ncbi:MAG: 2Fe-2S iron-sulfur cluster-binding protein [Clostridia bacterium]
MPTIQIHSQVAGPRLMAEAGTTLYALLSENGIHLDAPCGGKCYCGKCKVKVEPPLYEEMSAEEGALLSPQDMQASIRLACGYTIRTDAVVTLSPRPQTRGSHQRAGCWTRILLYIPPRAWVLPLISAQQPSPHICTIYPLARC